MANLFLGILVFRGVLAVKTFFYSEESLEFFGLLFKNILSEGAKVQGTFIPGIAVPLVLLGLGILVNIYSILVYASKRFGHNEY